MLDVRLIFDHFGDAPTSPLPNCDSHTWRDKVSRAAAVGLRGSQHVLTCHCSTEETSLLPKPQRGINIRQKEPSGVSSVQSDVSVLLS